MSNSRLFSLDAEHAVIGALLVDPMAADRLGALKPSHCYDESHRIILGTIMRMIAKGRQVDPITVAEVLQETGRHDQVGGLAYLGQLASNSLGSKNIGRYAETIVGKSLERQLLAAADTIRETVEGVGSTKEKLFAAQAAVMGVSEAVATKSPRMLREVLQDAAEVLDKRHNGKVPALPTGFSDLDRNLSSGLRNGNLIIVAGRPGMGKTALALNIAYNTSASAAKTLFLSMEMPEQELADRLIAGAGSVFLGHVLSGDMDGDSGSRIMGGIGKLYDLPLIIDDQGGLTLFDVATKARSVKSRHGLDVLILDYLQLMSGEGDNRNQQIEQITRGLKSLAKELNIPIIALSQLSRKCEERTNKRPMASDLRESGAIEQDADVILFVYRDEIYHPDSADKGTAEIIIGKNRQGQTGMVRMVYQGCYTKFSDIAPGWMPEHREEPKKYRRGMD